MARQAGMPPAEVEFQSSSGQKAGCNPGAARPSTSGRTCFNPHPARRPDATPAQHRPDRAGVPLVSILIRPEGRMQPGRGKTQNAAQRRFNPIRPEGRMRHPLPVIDLVPPDVVSILIRPEGRMQPGTTHRREARSPSSFNPHSARRPDATLVGCSLLRLTAQVSILIRPEGRMQHPLIDSRLVACLDQRQLVLPACCLTRKCYRNFSTWNPLQPAPFPAVHPVLCRFLQSRRKPALWP